MTTLFRTDRFTVTETPSGLINVMDQDSGIYPLNRDQSDDLREIIATSDLQTDLAFIRAEICDILGVV